MLDETTSTAFSVADAQDVLGLKDRTAARGRIAEIRKALEAVLAETDDHAAKTAARNAALAKMRTEAKAAGLVDVPEIIEADLQKEREATEALAAKKAEKEAATAAKNAEKAAAGKAKAEQRARDKAEKDAERLRKRQEQRDAKKPKQVTGATYQLLATYFRPLGYNAGTFYFIPQGSQQIVELTAAAMRIDANLYQLAPNEAWVEAFGNDEGLWYPSRAADFLINKLCVPAGVFSERNTRGRGVWSDAGRTVVHLGDRLVVDGNEVRIPNFESRYTYELKEMLDADLRKQLTAAEGRRIRKILGMSRWEQQASATLLAGFLFTAPVCGALAWRPHVYVTGPAGCGKSAIFTFVSALLGGVAINALGDSTAAGVRQKLSFDSRPLIFDEFESEDRTTAERIRGIMSIARQASSENAARSLRGTADGSGTDFVIRASFFFSSINLNVQARADEERVTVLTLKKGVVDPKTGLPFKSEQEKWDERQAMVSDILTPDIAARLMARAVNMLPKLMATIKVFRKVVLTTPGLANERTADQLGTLLAGAWCLGNDDVVSEELARKFVGMQDWAVYLPNSVLEEQRLMSAIMQARCPDLIDHERMVVSELVELAAGRDEDATVTNRKLAWKALQRVGIRVEGDKVFISTASRGLSDLLSGTNWANAYKEVLRRCKGASAGGSKRFAGDTENCIGFPIDCVLAAAEDEDPFSEEAPSENATVSTGWASEDDAPVADPA